MFSFSLGTELIFGAKALDFLATLHPEKTLLVTDTFFAKNGLAEKILGIVGGEGKLFDKVQPDPSSQTAAEGGALLRQFSPDLLIALGGGSSMDCAKGILLSAERRPTFVAIPTTSGTGSEVTSFSILTHEGVKYPLIDKSMRPDYAILDESLLTHLPPQLIADSGMDAVSHCVEALCAKGATAISDSFAIAALDTLLRLMPKSYMGDASVRGEIHLAATMAGIAFDNAGLGLCHALCHALGGAFHVPHGRLCGVMLPLVMELNEADCLRKLARAANLCGIDGSVEKIASRNLRSKIKVLRSALQLPETLQEAGVNTEELDQKLDAIVAAASDDRCLRGNPRPVSCEEMKTLLRRAAR